MQYRPRSRTNFSVTVTDNGARNELAHFSAARRLLSKMRRPTDLDFPPFTSTLRRSSPLVFRGIKFARITPAHLHKLKQGSVIYLLPLVVPFSWLSEITANINRGYKKGLWTLGRVDYAMNQFINGGPQSNAGEGGIYSFIKLCLQHLSSPTSRAPKM